MDLNEIRPRLPQTIATARLELRRPVFADVPAITVLANNKKISDMLSNLPHPYTSEDAIWFLENRARSDTEHSYAVTMADGLFVGMCGLIVKPDTLPEIGYWLGEAHWGAGLASEAAAGLIEAIFAAGAPVVTARALAVNAASCRVLEKLGFTLTDDRIGDCGQHKGVRVRFFALEATMRRRRAP
jgi:RimJ/RimL family protein N-acetyltransferase